MNARITAAVRQELYRDAVVWSQRRERAAFGVTAVVRRVYQIWEGVQRELREGRRAPPRLPSFR